MIISLRYFKKSSQFFLEVNSKKVQDFIDSLLKINTAQESVLHYLKSLEKLESFSQQEFDVDSLLLLDRFHLVQFFDMAQKLNIGLQNQRKIFFQIKKFYEWAMLNRLILTNPCPQLDLGRPSGKILICSQEQYLSLKSFIRNPNTDPESAMLLSLVLFFGFSTVQLAQAQLINQDDRLYIKLRRKQLSKGKKYYSRKELLDLPVNPKWFLALQKRFFACWLDHYRNVKKTYPNTPLILPKSNIANRYLNTATVRLRIRCATEKATGQSIPIRVLRQTCGHLYSAKADASILSNMGWSDQFAFHYTWLPRSYYQK